MIHGALQNIFDNPILTRELRRRMRGKALVYSIMGYIVLMTLTSIIVLLANLNPFGQESGQQMLARLSDTGHSLFRSIAVIQSLLVLIIAPTITAGMTTGEKERKTFDFLRVTTITPWMYVLGCFLSTVFYVGLALLCALPLISLAFLYGGIGSTDVLGMVGLLMGASMVLSAFGLYVSSVRERTRTAQGIVVFMIFALLFGGIALLNRLAIWLGGAGGGISLGSSLAVFGIGIPFWVIGFFGIVCLSTVFLLIATRKLFEPDETRAFSHWQFGLFFVIVGLLSIGLVSGRVLTSQGVLLYLACGSVLLMVAVSCFAVGRMEVGDEIWHLKRLVPLLRPFDQTVPFLILVALLWWGFATSFQKNAVSLGTVSGGLIPITAAVSIAGYVCFCTIGRWATAISVGRRGAGRIVLAAMLFMWVILPIIAWVMIGSFDDEGVISMLAHTVGRFSPFFVMSEGVASPRLYGSGDYGRIMLPMIVYGILGLGFAMVGEFLRFRRWRGFDYHYDMPAA